MGTGRYKSRSDEDLRELAASELTDEGWRDLEVEFRVRGFQLPVRPERSVSKRELGTDRGSRLFRKAVLAVFLIVASSFAKMTLENVGGTRLPFWPFIVVITLIFPVLDKTWSARREMRGTTPADSHGPPQPIRRPNPTLQDLLDRKAKESAVRSTDEKRTDPLKR